MISPGCLQVAERNFQVVCDAKRPQIQTDVHSFIVLCNLYQRYIKGFAKLVAALNRKLENGQPDRFGYLGGDEIQAF